MGVLNGSVVDCPEVRLPSFGLRKSRLRDPVPKGSREPDSTGLRESCMGPQVDGQRSAWKAESLLSEAPNWGGVRGWCMDLPALCNLTPSL